MTTIQQVELGVLGPLHVRQFGLPVAIPGAKPRAVLTLLGLYGGCVVAADTLVELLWGDAPPRTAAKALQTHVSSLRRALGDGFVLTQGSGWTLSTAEVDAARYTTAATSARAAMASGNAGEAVVRYDEALTLWRGAPELPDGRRGQSERTRWIEGHAALVEDRADALLATGRAAEIVGELEAAIADAPLRERRWGQLMLALYRGGRQGEALAGYQRVRSLLAEELGVDPGPELRRLQAAIVAQDISLELPVSQRHSGVTRAVTFLLTDIEGSTAAWEHDADAMAAALARHDEIIEQVVTSRGGRLIKTRGEGDATFSVFDRPSASAAAAIEMQEAIRHEPWALSEPLRIRVALHTGEVEFRDGDYFGRAVNRAARLRSLAAGGQILCSGATAELVIDTLADDVILVDLGTRQLKNLARPERVFELRLQGAADTRALIIDTPLERPALPAVLAGPGPFVGRDGELERLLTAWRTTLTAGTAATLVAGEPGVGKTRLAGEWSRRAYDDGAVVLYGRCDEDLGAPYQPFAEAMRALVPCLGTQRLRGLRGVEALLALVPGLADVLPDLAPPPRADADTERYALFDAVVGLLGTASASAPVVLILDDLHWAAKPTLLLLRHLLRFGEHARVQIVGTYRSTDLDRSHPLAAMLADLNRDGSVNRLQLGGLDEADVTAYVTASGYDDEDLARALASVTGGNPFFLIEALRHVNESDGRWDPSTLPQGVREAVSRRLSRLPVETNKALAAAAVVGSRFAVELVERVVEHDLVDAFDEASKAGIVIEEPGGWYRFNHAIVRQSLLAELASVRRMRLHQRIAAALEAEPGAGDDLLAELAYHYFECAWAGNAAKAVDYCRRAADHAMARLAYEGAADLYDKALHALAELDDDLPDRDEQHGELLIARCEALLAAGDVVSATGAVAQLLSAAGDSGRLAAWGMCFDGQLSVLTDPERLDEVELAVDAAAARLAELDDAAGEAKAHTVRATCLGRLGRIGDCETALDRALTAARRAREHRRVNSVLANAPLAALWGPSPVPRAGGRCLDVVRLLRITTGSPVVEATSTRCQGVLDAFRGRASAGRQLIDSARRSLTDLGMRHALLEVEQFTGIIELVADDPVAAERHLRQAYNGFRRMGLDADTAETAALLARACLALDRLAEADELCAESERLAGHALKASISWRTVRAQLLARNGAHAEARRVAEEAVAIAERTDALVDHGDACLALAAVVNVAGDTAGARAAAERAVELYELKGAAALAEKARGLIGKCRLPTSPVSPEATSVEPGNACVRAIRQLSAALERKAWAEYEHMFATEFVIESRRKIVGFPRTFFSSNEWTQQVSRLRGIGAERHRIGVVAVRGERLALTRVEMTTEDTSPGAPHEEVLLLHRIDDDGRFDLAVLFDIDGIDAAVEELDAAHTRLEDARPRAALENAASRVDAQFQEAFTAREWTSMAEILDDDFYADDRRHVVNSGLRQGRDAKVADMRATADLGTKSAMSTVIAIRGQYLALARIRLSGRDQRPEAFHTEMLGVAETNRENRMVARVLFGVEDVEAAFEDLDARYRAGEAAARARTWSVITGTFAAFNRREAPATTPNWVNIDHRSVVPMQEGGVSAALGDFWDLTPDIRMYVEEVHRLTDLGAVVTWSATGTSQHGFDAEWRDVCISTVESDLVNRCELFNLDDLDAALARFDELNRPARRVENAASRAYGRLSEYFSNGQWDALSKLMAPNMIDDDRRSVVNAGVRCGRDAVLATGRAVAATGTEAHTSTVIATRGERLALCRTSISEREQRTGAFQIDFLSVVEVDSGGRLACHVAFAIDHRDQAFAELDARYLVREAASHAQTWSAVAEVYAAFNRAELPSTTSGYASVDHRRGAGFAPGELFTYLQAAWEDSPGTMIYVETVHRLSDRGAVVTHAASGVSREGFDAEWRDISVGLFDGGLLIRTELFDHDDLDAALARFDELSRSATPLKNSAAFAWARLTDAFNRRVINEMLLLTAPDGHLNDRRTGVRDALEGSSRRRVVETLFEYPKSWSLEIEHVATRGTRLCLSRQFFRDTADAARPITIELLTVLEVDENGLAYAFVNLDTDDLDAAFAELDARYCAGEAEPYSDIWSLVSRHYAAINRRELPNTAAGWINVDHRRVPTIEAGEMLAHLSASWDLSPDLLVCIEAVHALNDRGAVLTVTSSGRSAEGFVAEWRMVHVVTFVDELINCCELFDEEDRDAALARFDELNRPVRHLENAASRMHRRFNDAFANRHWAAMAEMITDDIETDDRRRLVSGGVQRGRDAQELSMRAAADVGVKSVESFVIATRGDRLALIHARVSGDGRPEAFGLEMLTVVEVDSDNRFAAGVLFDPDDVDAAFAELDTRYSRGEAAPCARTWSVIASNFAAFNRKEFPSTTHDWVTIDHRRAASVAPDDLPEYIRAAWDDIADLRTHIEAVHQIADSGTVVTQVTKGTSQQGFEAEWREINVTMIDGELVTRAELFNETDLNAALARFDELSRPATRLENAAVRAHSRFQATFLDRQWGALAGTLAPDHYSDDRRRVVNSGIVRGRDAEVASMQAMAELGAMSLTSDVIAIRGDRLGLCRILGAVGGDEAFYNEVLRIVEIDGEERIIARVVFDVDDIDAAFADLDSRYLAGEAAAHSRTWSLVVQTHAAFNRHELSKTTSDWVNVDHRLGVGSAPGDMNAYVSTLWPLVPDFRTRIQAVHRLSDLGAVFTHTETGKSQEGFDAERREIALLTFDGDAISCCELFDETDLDAALARFDELGRPARQLANAASLAGRRLRVAFAARDWGAMTDLLSENHYNEDRRSVVNSGARHGRESVLEDLRAAANMGIPHFTVVEIATRGKRLVLVRAESPYGDGPSAFRVDNLAVGEIDADGRIAAQIIFDADDLDSAFAELDARYLAGDAAFFAQPWKVIAGASSAFNRREPTPITPDCIAIDHRLQATISLGAADELAAYVQASWDLTPELHAHIETVHVLSSVGAVVTTVTSGTTPEGFHAEWRQLTLMTVRGGLGDRVEIFDEVDLGTALARFDELNSPAPQLGNAASRAGERLAAAFAACDWKAVERTLDRDFVNEDRRRVVNAGVRHGRDAEIDDLRASSDVGFAMVSWSVAATRGQNLALSRGRYARADGHPEAFRNDVLHIVEINGDTLIASIVIFDADDLDSAVAELDARYVAGEAAAHASTWSAIVDAIAAFNRHVLPPTTPEWESVDHRNVIGFAPCEMTAYVQATFDVAPSVKNRVVTVHRLSHLGAVFTQASYATSQQGFDGEWHETALLMMEGAAVSRCEVFDLTDLDIALERFDELSQPAQRLSNAASEVGEHFVACFVARDWPALSVLLADDHVSDDRRAVVNLGIQRGREAQVANMRATVEVGFETIVHDVVATRGERLVLARVRAMGNGALPTEIDAESLGLVEIDEQRLITANVVFDADDFDSAFAELDARYLAGEAAEHAGAYSVVVNAYDGVKRHELPNWAADFESVDNRSSVAFAPGELSAHVQATFEDTPDARVYVEAVHALNDVGVLVTHVTSGMTRQEFEAEWRMITLTVVDVDLISRSELYDADDLARALARFDELS